MSIEGMWGAFFGDRAVPGQRPNRGVMIFESGKVFGGDSVVAYLGEYSVKDGRLHGSARVWSYDKGDVGGMTAFGRPTPVDVRIIMEGAIDDQQGIAQGFIWESDNPAQRLPITLRRISDLP